MSAVNALFWETEIARAEAQALAARRTYVAVPTRANFQRCIDAEWVLEAGRHRLTHGPAVNEAPDWTRVGQSTLSSPVEDR